MTSTVDELDINTLISRLTLSRKEGICSQTQYTKPNAQIHKYDDEDVFERLKCHKQRLCSAILSQFGSTVLWKMVMNLILSLRRGLRRCKSCVGVWTHWNCHQDIGGGGALILKRVEQQKLNKKLRGCLLGRNFHGGEEAMSRHCSVLHFFKKPQRLVRRHLYCLTQELKT